MEKKNKQPGKQNTASSIREKSSTKELILVTGSSGLIGSKIIEHLTDRYQIIGLDIKGNPYASPKSEWICVDLSSDKSVKNAFERIRYQYGSKIASVVHLAAYYDFSGKASPLYDEITVSGTERLLNNLKEMETGQFIFSSTNLVYKSCEPGQKIDEDWPLEPTWPYPESKVKTEKRLLENHGQIPLVIQRIAGVYDDYCHSLPISHQIQRIYEKEFTSHLYSGDPSHGNAFIHLEDLTSAIVKTIENRKKLPLELVVNIAEPHTFSYEALQERIGILLYGEKWKTYEVPKPLAKAGAEVMDVFGESFIKPWMIDQADFHFEHDISRARELLDWEPKHNLMDTLPKMVEKLKKDPLKWYKENKLEVPSGLDS